MAALHGWHRGEQLAHRKLGLDNDAMVHMLFTSISGELPDEHAKFHSTCLPFLPVTTLDQEGRPWGSILSGSDGIPGFVANPRYNTLTIQAKLWVGEPLIENAKSFSANGEMLIAGIGIQLSTRRRNKFAGKVTKMDNGEDIRLEVSVTQTIGNCPKYITIRDLEPRPHTFPKIVHKQTHLPFSNRLPDDIISFIQEADTVFLGSTYVAGPNESNLYPSHLGMNHRGGRQGFIRVVPSDGRTIIIPDYSGNRLMTSLGNIEATPLASLTFISFTTGSILYITGDAKNVFGNGAQKIMPLQNALTSVSVTGYIFVADALPARQRESSHISASPYSPPIRYLAEESPRETVFDINKRLTATLTRIELHSPTVATFSWEASEAFAIKPGQAVILDLSPLIGPRQYQHMSLNPTSVNDDRIRTWTVSSVASENVTKAFSLTMRLKPQGLITTALFTIANKLKDFRPELLHDSKLINLVVEVVGTAGDFVLPELEPPLAPSKKLLWIAGGIGLTPFLSMLKKIVASSQLEAWDVVLLLSTREPEVLLPLLSDASTTENSTGRNATLSVHIFSRNDIITLQKDIKGSVHRHLGRITGDALDNVEDLPEREVFICGPEEFEKYVLGLLSSRRVHPEKVKREGFVY